MALAGEKPPASQAATGRFLLRTASGGGRVEGTTVTDGLLLSIGVRDRGADVVLQVSGELDFGTTPDLLEVAEPLATAGRSLVLDLAGLAFCDSSALSALVRLHKAAEASGGSLCLARLRPQVEATITVTMLHRLLVIKDDVPEGASEDGRS